MVHLSRFIFLMPCLLVEINFQLIIRYCHAFMLFFVLSELVFEFVMRGFFFPLCLLACLVIVSHDDLLQCLYAAF